MVRHGMGLLDVPKGLLSRLPVIGGSNEPKDDEPEKPTAEAPEPEPNEPEDEPDAVEDEPVEEADDPDEDQDEPDLEEDEPDSEDDEPASKADSEGKEDISDITAPSIGPNTKIEKEDPEERLARHEQSDTDAMGLDKRREVIGGSYSASFGKQLIRWTVVVAIIAAAAFGARLLVEDLDKPPAKVADEAPWAGNQSDPAALE